MAAVRDIRIGWHIRHEGIWRLVNTVAYPADSNRVELEVITGLRRTEIVRYAAGHAVEAMTPGEWFLHVARQRTAQAAQVPPAAWGPAERLARGLSARPGFPAPNRTRLRRASSLETQARVFGHTDGVPYGAFLTYPLGPPLVPADGWACDVLDDGEGGATITARRRLLHQPEETHPLHATAYLTKRAARRALYEAGLLKYLVHHNTNWMHEAISIIVLNEAADTP